nr:hypothetical protein Iba_chr06cCG8550 [Ipomoea batatas]
MDKDERSEGVKEAKCQAVDEGDGVVKSSGNGNSENAIFHLSFDLISLGVIREHHACIPIFYRDFQVLFPQPWNIVPDFVPLVVLLVPTHQLCRVNEAQPAE